LSFIKSINNEEIQLLPLFSYSGEVVIIDSKESYKRIIPEIFLERTWGFDTETKPCFKKGVANKQSVSLLQLSSAKKTYLFRLNKYGLQKGIITLLSDPRFIKIGVSIRDDIKALQKLKAFKAAGFIELQEMVKIYKIEDSSLKKLAAIVLGLRISKAQQLSNWEADQLKEKQIKYAATDSWISREIYLELLNSERI
jgi:ribonuclease D